jgi:hypothetical protein
MPLATGTTEFDDWIACNSAWRWLTSDTGKKIEQDQNGRVFATYYPKARPQQNGPD